MAKPDVIYVAISTGIANVAGKEIPFTRDKTFVRSGHPLLTQNPAYFQPVGEFLEAPTKR
jgi:hypothetical protein